MRRLYMCTNRMNKTLIIGFDLYSIWYLLIGKCEEALCWWWNAKGNELNIPFACTQIYNWLFNPTAKQLLVSLRLRVSMPLCYTAYIMYAMYIYHSNNYYIKTTSIRLNNLILCETSYIFWVIQLDHTHMEYILCMHLCMFHIHTLVYESRSATTFTFFFLFNVAVLLL